jgi:hypothetical protein
MGDETGGSRPAVWTITPEVKGEFADWLREFDGESDRACAILATAYLDDQLAQLLLAYMIDEAASVNLVERSLSNFNTRINVSYALGLIGKVEHDDLHVLRAVRNQFAHKLMGLSFADAWAATTCRELKVISVMKWPIIDVPGVAPARAQFSSTAGVLAVILKGRIAVTAHRGRVETLVGDILKISEPGEVEPEQVKPGHYVDFVTTRSSG